MNAPIDLVKLILQRNEIDVRKTSKIINEITCQVEAGKEKKSPTVKKQFVVLVSDPLGALSNAPELTAWVLQIPEDDSPVVGVERLIRAGYEYNATPKGRKLPVKSIGEVCEAVPSRILKESQVWVKTKEPILVTKTDNALPVEVIA